jgi:hypothetical protein
MQLAKAKNWQTSTPEEIDEVRPILPLEPFADFVWKARGVLVANAKSANPSVSPQPASQSAIAVRKAR